MKPKDLIQVILNRFGYEIHKRDSRFHPELNAKRLCDQRAITCILDVGANTGQYGLSLREWGYNGRVISFEPLSVAHSALCSTASRDKMWQVAPRCAIGASKSISVINIAGNSVSSSLLDMLDSHMEAAPDSAYIDKEEVQIETLSEMIETMCDKDDRFYLKIDTQGYEREVLAGAVQCLERIPVVQMELSIQPLYANSLLIGDGIELMQSYGYFMYSIHTGFTDLHTGETLQVDAIFVKK